MGFDLVELIAKYPFLSQARALLQNDNVKYEELERAEDFVIDSLEKRKKETFRSAEEEARTLVLAKLLLASLQNELVARKFASSKAEEFVEMLKAGDESDLHVVAKEFFPSLDNQQISLDDFLKAGGKLADAQLEEGRVFLDEHALFRLLRNAIAFKLSDFSQVNLRNVPKLVREAGQELAERIPREPAFASAFKGKYLQLECVQKILKGVPEGKRYYGSTTLAIACVKDGLSREQAAQVMQDYVNNCPRGAQPFTLREALASVDWVYKHPTIGFSCSMNVSRGLIDSQCGNCIQRRKR
ncbi:MAG: hypothetical protein V1811_00970 [Candidatus Micrarchaeota archaeon]